MKKNYPKFHSDLLIRHKELEVNYDNLRDLYKKQLITTAGLQAENEQLERVCWFYKTVQIEHRHFYGAK